MLLGKCKDPSTWLLLLGLALALKPGYPQTVPDCILSIVIWKVCTCVTMHACVCAHVHVLFIQVFLTGVYQHCLQIISTPAH